MAGNKIGAQKAKAKLLAKDPEYFTKLGEQGYEGWVRNGRKPRGFSVDHERASAAGRKGGTASRRGKAKSSSKELLAKDEAAHTKKLSQFLRALPFRK